MKIIKIIVVALLSLVIVCYALTGGPWLRIPTIEVHVSDAITGKPVSGAVVATIWRTSAFLCIEGSCYTSFARQAEGVTDTRGVATIPKASVRRHGFEVVDRTEPQILVYKRGYVDTTRAGNARALRPVESPSEQSEVARAISAHFGTNLWQIDPAKLPLLGAEIRRDAGGAAK